MKLLNAVSDYLPRTCLFAGAVLSLLCAVSTQANVVQLSFSGTYDTLGNTVFGLSGSAVPFSYQLTYDTSLNTSPYVYLAGSLLEGYTTTDAWYGYSASGIRAATLTFGNQTWTAVNISPRTLGPAVSADLWFNRDLSFAPPTLCLMTFLQGSRELDLGDGAADSKYIYMLPESFLTDPGPPSDANSFNLTIQSVPEPGVLTLMALGGLGLLRRTKRR
jgi:hypothetical protein